jgi:hypothetical protein
MIALLSMQAPGFPCFSSLAGIRLHRIVIIDAGIFAFSPFFDAFWQGSLC